jgi:hypothetical protein
LASRRRGPGGEGEAADDDGDRAQTPCGAHHRPSGLLAKDLAGVVEGEVRFDPGTQALYASDASIYVLPGPVGRAGAKIVDKLRHNGGQRPQPGGQRP